MLGTRQSTGKAGDSVVLAWREFGGGLSAGSLGPRVSAHAFAMVHVLVGYGSGKSEAFENIDCNGYAPRRTSHAGRFESHPRQLLREVSSGSG